MGATDAVLRVIAERMHEADVLEAAALGFASPFDALVRSRNASSFCLAAVTSDEEAELLGVGGLITADDWQGVAVPWAILTDAGARRKRWVLREARHWIGIWRQSFELRNAVHATNARGRALVEVLGFRIESDPYRHETTGEPFLFFTMSQAKRREVPVCASS